MKKKSSSPWMDVVLLAGIFTLAAAAWAEPVTKTLISDEQVPVYLAKGSVVCHDRIPDQGFGPVPASLSIGGKKLFDRTLRLDGAGGVWLTLPDTVTCADLKPALDLVPEDVTAERKLYRTVEVSFDKKRKISRLQAEIALPLPVPVDGKATVLRGNQYWVEDNSPASDPTVGFKPFPIVSSYNVITHPQSATDTVGLFCKAEYEGSTTYLLSLGEVSGYDLTGSFANTDIVKRGFETRAACEDTHDELMDIFTAEDPGNWGTIFKVQRSLELTHRYILDNQANQLCQEIELEVLHVVIRGGTFRAAASFPLRNVDMKECLARATVAR